MDYAYVDCPHCGREAKIEDSLVGQNVNCPGCGEAFLAEVGGSYDLEGGTPSRPESTRGPEVRDPEPEEEEEKQSRKGWLEEWPQD